MTNWQQNLETTISSLKIGGKTLKHFIKPEHSTSLPPLHHDDAVFTEEPDEASLLNDFFVGQTNLDKSQASLPSDTPIPDNNLNSISTSTSEVASTSKSLQLGKATGPDAINNRILKELATPLSFPLSDLFNFSLATGKVPQMWKEANVTPIFKKEDSSVVSNYRPISLLSAEGKVLEKKMFTIICLISFANTNYYRLYNRDLFQVTQRLIS